MRISLTETVALGVDELGLLYGTWHSSEMLMREDDENHP